LWHNSAVSTAHLGFSFDNTYARELDGFFAPATPASPPRPTLVRLNRGLAESLGLDVDALAAQAAALFSGATVPPGAQPIAQAYAGHQFGGFSPQLGDGRALLLGELIDRAGTRRDLALKGSGRTVFSRGGDGKAALGPMLREYVMGEAMHALGIPTTCAASARCPGPSSRASRPATCASAPSNSSRRGGTTRGCDASPTTRSVATTPPSSTRPSATSGCCARSPPGRPSSSPAGCSSASSTA
jgi:uncharacterized protein YdiU (UPF0061 family)